MTDHLILGAFLAYADARQQQARAQAAVTSAVAHERAAFAYRAAAEAERDAAKTERDAATKWKWFNIGSGIFCLIVGGWNLAVQLFT